jgi:hypothetical protein
MSVWTCGRWDGELVFQCIAIAVVAVAFALRFRNALKENRRIEPIRREVRSHPVTFGTSVAVRIRRPSGELTLWGPLNLIVRAGFLEISQPSRPVAMFFGQEFYFRAADLRIETCWDQRERIRITDISYGTDASLSVISRTNLAGIWDALVNAGAVPVGPAPQAAVTPGDFRAERLTQMMWAARPGGTLRLIWSSLRWITSRIRVAKPPERGSPSALHFRTGMMRDTFKLMRWK